MHGSSSEFCSSPFIFLIYIDGEEGNKTEVLLRPQEVVFFHIQSIYNLYGLDLKLSFIRTSKLVLAYRLSHRCHV
jgi:hypothetical protein